MRRRAHLPPAAPGDICPQAVAALRQGSADRVGAIVDYCMSNSDIDFEATRTFTHLKVPESEYSHCISVNKCYRQIIQKYNITSMFNITSIFSVQQFRNKFLRAPQPPIQKCHVFGIHNSGTNIHKSTPNFKLHAVDWDNVPALRVTLQGGRSVKFTMGNVS